MARNCGNPKLVLNRRKLNKQASKRFRQMAPTIVRAFDSELSCAVKSILETYIVVGVIISKYKSEFRYLQKGLAATNTKCMNSNNFFRYLNSDLHFKIKTLITKSISGISLCVQLNYYVLQSIHQLTMR